MKKLFLAILILALLASLPCLAEEECVYPVDEALSIAAGGGASILRVDCGISWMTTRDAEDIDYGSWKMIVLQRKPGRKEFTALDSGYPGAMTEGFPDDYEGTDISEPEVYLRWDLMCRLPEKNRASSAADADFIVMIEDMYIHSSTITHTEFTGEDVMPDESFTTPEEIAEFYLAHPKYISSITYYPMFADVTLIYLCDPATNERVTYAYNIVMPVTLARNPQAAALWEEMTAIDQLAQMIEEYPAAADDDVLQEEFGSSEFVPQFSLNAWCAAAREGRQQDLVNAMRGTYWHWYTICPIWTAIRRMSIITTCWLKSATAKTCPCWWRCTTTPALIRS